MTVAKSGPPSLNAMIARVERLDAERRKLFVELAEALKKTGGNVTEAGALLDPPVDRNRVNYLVRRVGLVEFAAEIRKKTTGRAMGRPSK